jgi:hypothetical protein
MHGQVNIVVRLIVDLKGLIPSQLKVRMLCVPMSTKEGRLRQLMPAGSSRRLKGGNVIIAKGSEATSRSLLTLSQLLVVNVRGRHHVQQALPAGIRM